MAVVWQVSAWFLTRSSTERQVRRAPTSPKRRNRGHLGTLVEVNSQYSHQMTAAKIPDKQLILSVWEPRVGRRAALGIWWSWLVLAQAIYLAAFGFIAVLLAIRYFILSMRRLSVGLVHRWRHLHLYCLPWNLVIPSRRQPISRTKVTGKNSPPERKQPLLRCVCEERVKPFVISVTTAHAHLWLSQRQECPTNQSGASGAASRRAANSWSKAFLNCRDDSEVTLTRYPPTSLAASAAIRTVSLESNVATTWSRIGLVSTLRPSPACDRRTVSPRAALLRSLPTPQFFLHGALPRRQWQ